MFCYSRTCTLATFVPPKAEVARTHMPYDARCATSASCVVALNALGIPNLLSTPANLRRGQRPRDAGSRPAGDVELFPDGVHLPPIGSIRPRSGRTQPLHGPKLFLTESGPASPNPGWARQNLGPGRPMLAVFDITWAGFDPKSAGFGKLRAGSDKLRPTPGKFD